MIGLWIDHMSGRPRGIGIDLIENIGKLHVKLIFSYKANMRRGQNIRVCQKNIFTIQKGLLIEHIHSGVKLALRKICPANASLFKPIKPCSKKPF